MTLRDTLERLFWTVLSAFGGALLLVDAVDLEAVQAAAIVGATAGINFVTILARAKIAALPNPGDGLPGLPTQGEP